ncbi:MAG: STAS domain-containing protein [Ignavibacteriales bacterium]|nr:STAS domain-containing protein [Ignavibacteriales bacterium]
MKFKSKEVKGIMIIELTGNVMGGPDATALNDQIHKLIGDQKKRIVIDLSDVKFINSSGLAMLISGLNTMRKSGGEMKLARASEKIETLLQMTKLNTVFDIHKTVNEAVEAFK